MNVERIINMVIRQLMRRVINTGINKGIDVGARAMSKKGGAQEVDPKEQNRRTASANQNAKRAKDMAKITRRISRF